MHNSLEEARNLLTPSPGSIPQASGVYRFYDEKDNLLYVGKAKNLANRLHNYFTLSGTLHGRMQEVLLNAHKVDWVLTVNEKEALILEAMWIRRYQPRYNIKLLDTDAFGGVVVYDELAVPKLGLWRGRRPKTGKSFGPFPGVKGREMLDTLSQSFEVRSCKETIYNRAVKQNKPCLLGEIGKCKAPCLGGENLAIHQKQSNLLIDFLRNSDQSYLNALEIEMENLAERQEYERATIKRDHLFALQKIVANQNANLNSTLDVEALAFTSYADIGALALLSIRQGEIKSLRVFAAEIDENLTASQQLIQILTVSILEEGVTSLAPCLNFIGNIPLTDLEVNLLAEIFSLSKLSYKNPKKGARANILALALRNAQESIGNLELKRNNRLSSRLDAMEQLRSTLGMVTKLNRIECIDISHTQGRQPVASIVTMIDGITQPRHYRRIYLPSFLGGDDYASIKYAVERRFTGNHCGLEGLPDLLLIDGGPIQAQSANAILAPLLEGSEIEIKVVGLAKRLEELWPAGDSDPLILSRDSQSLILCQRIRDEAHRWAIGGHRKEREKVAVESSLDQIKGIGLTKKKALLKHFGSELEVYRATQSELALVTGIGSSLAAIIYNQLHN